VIQTWLGHTTIAQTSTYLASTIQGQHDGMTRYDEHLQELATKPGKRSRKRPRRATTREDKPRFSVEKTH
jgi:hypothetical protein